MLINIILTLLILQQAILIITKAKPSVLACGLWCYCGKEPADPLILRMLALLNQHRGEHSTGMCVDDTVVRDTIPAKEFLIKHTEFFKYEDYKLENNVVLGHCRSATLQFDKTKLNYAHPHKTKKDGEDFLRLVHNGSISNYKDLADKYKISMTDKSDSILIAEILTQTWNTQWNGENKSVLQECDGPVTTVFYPVTAKNTLYVHRDLLRELFYWQKTPNQIYISSIKDSFALLGAEDKDVHEFVSGWLYKMVNGKIVKKWDLSIKNPYTLPKPKAPNYSHVTRSKNNSSSFRSRYEPSIEEVEEVNTNGFYLERHLVKYNGHIYTGELYIEKGTNNAQKRINRDQANKYDHHYVVNGITMKNMQMYNSLFLKCVKNNEFDVAEFKKLPASTLQDYAMFPVLGKQFSQTQEMVFWHDQLETLKTKDQKYTWTPLFSNKEYSINRAGFIVGTRDLTPSTSTISDKNRDFQIIDNLILNRLTSAQGSYDELAELWKDYKNASEQPDYEFAKFLELLLKYFKQCKEIPHTMIRDVEIQFDLDYTEDQEGWRLSDKILNLLKVYQSQLETPQITTVIDAETEITYNDDPGDEPWETEDFKEILLFGDYNTFKELSDTYMISNSTGYKKRFYMTIGAILRSINFIRSQDIESLSRGTLQDNEKTLSHLYSELRKEACLDTITEIFESGVSTEGFASLYQRYLTLDAKMGLSKRDELEFALIRLGLNYLRTKSEKLDQSRLIKEYNISEQDIVKACS